jgi:hypothetical protein
MFLSMIKKQFYLGFAGFAGLLSLRYFYTYNLFDLWYLGFFAFFSNFIIAKISGNKEDERFIDDRKTALAFTGRFAIIELYVIWCAAVVSKNAGFLCLLMSLSYAVTANVYAIKLYLLEEK